MFTMLGIDFDQYLEEKELTFYKALEKRKKVAKYFWYRYLTVFGKTYVIKALVLQKLMHIDTILPDITNKKD